MASSEHITDAMVRTAGDELMRHGLNAPEQVIYSAARAALAAAGPPPFGDDFLQRLRRANIARNEEYRAKTGGQELPLLFRATELAGEIGEMLNVIKKMERERLGWSGKRATKEDLREEIGGAMACFDLLAMTLGEDIAEATAAEFNKVTDRLGLTVRLSAPSAGDGWQVPPINVNFMLACYVSPEPGGVIWPGGWDSPAGKDTRDWLLRNGLIASDYSPTERGKKWVEALLSTPLPAPPAKVGA